MRLYPIWARNMQWLRKSLVGCRWVYTMKIGLDSRVDLLKAQLVAKGYT